MKARTVKVEPCSAGGFPRALFKLKKPPPPTATELPDIIFAVNRITGLACSIIECPPLLQVLRDSF